MSVEALREGWDRAARQDAMFNILTDHPRGPEEFFAHGRDAIRELLDYLDAKGLTPHPHRALDFGCGVGRLTQALADHFSEVHGTDVSPEMVKLAREHNRHGDRVHYHVNDTDLSAFRDDMFDLVYTTIVLQHMPQELQRGYVREFVRVTRPDGLAVFHIPEGPDYSHPANHLSMCGVDRVDVERWVADAGGRVVGVHEFPQSEWTGYRYSVRPA